MNAAVNATKGVVIASEKKLMLRRTFKAPAHRVFQAWIDPADLAKWYTPDAAWPARVSEADIRVGGGFLAAFGPPGEEPWIERVQYSEIAPPDRLVMLSYMTHAGAFVACTRCEVGFIGLDGGTEMTLIDSGADPALLVERAGGWGGTLDNLARLLG